METERTIKGLIEFLKTLDPEKTINATYIETLCGQVKDEKIRPFIWEDLIKETDSTSYTIKPLYY